MDSIAVVSGSELLKPEWELIHRGYALVGVPTKHFKVMVVIGDRPGSSGWVIGKAKSDASYNVAYVPTAGRYTDVTTDILTLTPVNRAVTARFEIVVEETSERPVVHVRLASWVGSYPQLPPGVPRDPVDVFWWNWSRWYSKMVPQEVARGYVDRFVEHCVKVAPTTSARNREANIYLARLAKNNGWREMSKPLAARLGLSPGWIRDDDFHRQAEAVFPNWVRTPRRVVPF